MQEISQTGEDSIFASGGGMKLESDTKAL